MAEVTFSFAPGSRVCHKGKLYCITQQLDLERVLAQSEESGEFKTLYVRHLTPAGEDTNEVPKGAKREVILVSDDDWNIAQKRFDTIRPFVVNPPDFVCRADVEQRAKDFGVSTATVYRWIQRYRDSGKITSLVPERRGAKRGSVRLEAEVNAIIDEVIESKYLTSQQRTVQWICNEVIRLCRNAGLHIPHENTIRQRIARLSERRKFKHRHGNKAAENKYAPLQGEFPDGAFPLDVVQIDHTKMDIVLVDDIHRMPVDRPWITLAIDVFSRMVTGFYISFDPPGALSVGLCLAHSILTKDTWLEKYDVNASWPVWGLMKTIHADNAKEFRGEMLKRACTNYGVDLSWRPVARPHYGAHIERLLGTFNKEIHNLSGTTFNNPSLRKNYNSEKKAVMTLSEFERWLTVYITEVYHQKKHSALDMSPLAKYEEGVFGTENKPGTGLAPRISDEVRLRLDLMPFVERTVQRYGVLLDKIYYFADILRPYINMTEEGNSRQKRMFLFRRDPRDISSLYFFDPETEEYYPVPYRNTSHPAISIWEYRAARKMAEDSGDEIDEDSIFRAYDKLRELEVSAKQETKKVRRAQQRKRQHEAVDRPFKSSSDPAYYDNGLFADIKPFDEKEILDEPS